MSDTVITVENLCKKYTIGHQKQARYETFRDSLNHMGRGLLQRLKHPLSPNTEQVDLEEFWALKDVSFEIKRGDRVGIIGRNGAGKSTLLKILSRITEPTSGRVTIKGRVASLLEVGTGFHPELTGRENIFLNGAILGMSRIEIKKKFDEIVDFAEIEKFLDTPVKRYSSGMYVRLAFAVAAHLEPDILLVDEVLAVGDAEFQKKCLGKMKEVGREGRTILFVSHNMAAIQKLCLKCFLFKNGSLTAKGLPEEIIHSYLDYPTEKSKPSCINLKQWQVRYGSGEAIFKKVYMFNNSNKLSTIVQRLSSLTFLLKVESHTKKTIILSAVISSHDDTKILNISSYDSLSDLSINKVGTYVVRVIIPQLPLSSGNYNITFGLHDTQRKPFDVVERIISFSVVDTTCKTRPFQTSYKHGFCWTKNNWIIQELTKRND